MTAYIVPMIAALKSGFCVVGRPEETEVSCIAPSVGFDQGLI